MLVGRSCGVTQKAKPAVQIGVVALSRLVTSVLTLSSPQLIAMNGTTLLNTAINTKEMIRRRTRVGVGLRRITRLITSSVRAALAVCTRTKTVGLMSTTASLINRNELPHIKDSRVRAA